MCDMQLLCFEADHKESCSNVQHSSISIGVLSCIPDGICLFCAAPTRTNPERMAKTRAQEKRPMWSPSVFTLTGGDQYSPREVRRSSPMVYGIA